MRGGDEPGQPGATPNTGPRGNGVPTAGPQLTLGGDLGRLPRRRGGQPTPQLEARRPVCQRVAIATAASAAARDPLPFPRSPPCAAPPAATHPAARESVSDGRTRWALAAAEPRARNAAPGAALGPRNSRRRADGGRARTKLLPPPFPGAPCRLPPPATPESSSR